MMSGISKVSWHKTAQCEECGNLEGVYPVGAIKFTVFPKIRWHLI